MLRRWAGHGHNMEISYVSGYPDGVISWMRSSGRQFVFTCASDVLCRRRQLPKPWHSSGRRRRAQPTPGSWSS